MRAQVTTACFAALLLGNPKAYALEREWHVGGGIGIASFRGGGTSPTLGLFGAYGITDSYDVRLELSGASFDFTGDSEADDPTRAYSALTGIGYRFDVIEWVPHVGLLIGYTRFSGGPLPEERRRNEVSYEVAAGLDYVLSRHVGLGIQFGARGFLLNPPSSFWDTPGFVGMLRAEHHWGW